jgi:hypothetical protein
MKVSRKFIKQQPQQSKHSELQSNTLQEFVRNNGPWSHSKNKYSTGVLVRNNQNVKLKQKKSVPGNSDGSFYCTSFHAF